MISVVVPLEMFTEFVGGGEVHSNEILKRLSKTTDVFIIPYTNNIVNFKNKKICELLRDLPYYFPKVIHQICSGDKINFGDAVKNLSEEVKQTDLIYEPNLHITLNIKSLSDKIKLITKSFRSPVYCTEELIFDSFCIAKRANRKLVSVIHPDLRSYKEGLRIAYYGIRYQFNDSLSMLKSTFTYKNILKINEIINDPLFKNLLSVSKAINYLDVKHKKVRILRIANAYNTELLKYRTKKKEDYIVFWARLYSLKGILEVPYIIRQIVKKYDDIKLKLFGKFYNDIEKNHFFNLLKKLGIERNVEYLGFLPEEKKYEIVSKARAVLYPSHSDSFSLVILESLALGTPVVAYDLLGPRSVYEGLSAVKFVKEFDIKGMAREVLKLITMKDEEYYALIYNRQLDAFLEEHSSWDKVAEEIFTYLFN